MVVRKKFSPSLYKKYNKMAIAAGTKYLEANGFTITSSKEDKKADFHATKDNKDYLFEVEVKNVWSGEWPKAWKDIQLPERKSRLIKYADSQNKKLNFLIFRNDLKAAWKIDGDIVSNSNTKEVSNRYVPNGEMFYIVPIEKAKYIEL